MGLWETADLAVGPRHLHGHVADRQLRFGETITDEQRLAVVRFKDVWHRLPGYPDSVGGEEIYTAVLGDGPHDNSPSLRVPLTVRRA